ncbi:MAG: protein TolQ [Ghiorsea sp.]
MNDINTLSVWTLVLDAGVVVQAVLILLLLLSFMSWAIIFNKWRIFRATTREDTQFIDFFWGGADMDQVLAKAKSFKHSPQAAVFHQGFREYLRLRQAGQQQHDAPVAANGMLSVRHAIDSQWSDQMEKHGSGLSFLATVGSTAPFIGLFGTVWGIIDAFQHIGITQNTSLATVAPGIAEALVATAFGLLAAIPAVIAYNTFSGKMKSLNNKLDSFATEFVNILSRHVRK